MLADRTMQVRNHLLSLLEQGDLVAGDRLPSARDLAVALGISFIKVQQAIETLAFDGIIEVRPRIGAFVQAGWRDRVLVENLSVFNRPSDLPWTSGVAPLLQDDLPGLRFTHHFPRSVLELRTTLTLQTHHDEYLDLGPILDEVAPRRDVFFQEPFAPFRVGGRLVGVPFIFSPRVVCYQPEIFARHGVAPPEAGWTWDDLVDHCRRLAPVLPPGGVLNWTTAAWYWLNVVLRGGGHLFADDVEDPIRLDDPRTVAALRRFQELGVLLGGDAYEKGAFRERFLAGEAAMAIADRQFLSFLRRSGGRGWRVVPMPHMPDGVDVTSQATDLLCVRATCTNPGLARTYLAAMLSERVQDYIAAEGYGIPIRRSSAFTTLDLRDAEDSVLIAEMGKVVAEPCLADPALARQVLFGVERLLAGGADLDRALPRLAAAAREWWRTSRYLAGRPSAARAVSQPLPTAGECP